MQYFIFRNNTVEPYFGTENILYSGYDDISVIPEEVSSYIWFYQVPYKYNLATLAAEIEGYIGKLRLVCQQIPSHKLFIVFTLENLYPICYTDSDACVMEAIQKFNTECRQLTTKYGNVKMIDFSEFTVRYPLDQLVDWKFYFISQMGLNPRLSGTFQDWFSKKLDSIQLKRKKCLVLDLDNTLWGGILGEDGIEGIKIGGDYPGKAFLSFQQGLAELSKTGVILTVCSKNNEKDVLEAWEKNPFIILKQEYISAYRINWHNKADNIKELAEELNIGLDSFVFIDDNPTERELVKQLLPMVEVPDFPSQPYRLPAFFQTLVNTYFRVYAITDEDKNKTLQYKTNADRAREQQKFTDFSDYLKSLKISITIDRANEFNLSRIAQMTQKTNQFNLTTQRYTDSDLQGFLQSGWKIYCISVSDRFGDSGITGAILLKPNAGNYEIDSFLLSCRILSKGIEIAFIRTIINILYKEKIKQLKATYIPTKKNIQVADFYDKIGFRKIQEGEDGGKAYALDLDKETEIEDYYTITIQ